MIENGDDSLTMEDTKKFLPKETDFNNNLVGKTKKFAGLSKEEVLAYSADPAWVKLRWILFIVFWLIWFGLLGSVIGIVFMTPKCAPKPTLDWWQKELVYQIDVKKFMDSTMNGVGDLNGIVEKIKYFKELGVEAICLRSNIFKADSPKELAEGMLRDFKLKDVKKRLKSYDIHLILDITYKVANPSSLMVDPKGQNVVAYWLEELADGIRITETPEDTELSELDNLMDIADQVGDKTFEKKFISFNTASQDLKRNLKIGEEYPWNERQSVNERPLFIADRDNLDATGGFLDEVYESSTGAWPAFTTSSYSVRITNQTKNRRQLHATHGITLLLRGTPFIMYGDELELTDHRNGNYMRWNNEENCGFSLNRTLGLKDCVNSVQDLFSHGAGQNLVHMYKKLSKLRKEPSFAWGEFHFERKDKNTRSIMSFIREAEGFDGYLVATNYNVDDKAESTDFKQKHDIPRNGTVAYFYSDREASRNEFKIGLEVFTERIILKSGELLVVRFDKRS